MQYRLSTLFLIFFLVATSLAAFGIWGLWFIALVLIAAVMLNRAKQLSNGAAYVWLLLVYGWGPLALRFVVSTFFDPNGSKRTPIGGYLAFAVWLVSVVLLFRRAVKSRKPAVVADAGENSPPAG
jgi:hypothetical protein